MMWEHKMRKLREDDGVALVAVMGAIALISIIAVSGYMMSSQALHETTRLSFEERAFQVAASGMDRELASFSEDNFTSGSATYVKSGATPDGSFQLTVGRDPVVPFMYTMTCVGTAGGRNSTVEQSFFYMDLWGMSISAGSNPGGEEFGSGAGWNGNSTVYGPLYVTGDVALNSNPDLYFGPLFVNNGSIDFGASVDFHPYTDAKYNIFASGNVSGADADCEIFNSCPSIDLPWLDDAYFDGMKEDAIAESRDNLWGPASVATVANNEVDAAGYIGTKAPGATADYKVINGPLTITGATGSFGKLTGQRDDFAFDTNTNVLYLDGVVFVDGDVTIGSGVVGYAGSGMLVATGDVTIQTGTSAGLQPIDDNGDGKANDLSTENCLGIATMGDLVIHGCTFEGVVFTNNALRLAKVGSVDAEFEGAIHSNNIISDTPQNILEMELEFNVADLPVGMAGSPTDPRGAEFASSGMVVPGTWVRRENP